MNTTTTVLLVLAFLCALIAILPMRFDPAIRLKEWAEKRRRVVVEEFSGQKMRDMPGGQLGKIIQNGRCPDCRSKEGFYEGPRGGISTNIFCSNCGHGFNITPIFNEPYAERIHNLNLKATKESGRLVFEESAQ